MVYIQRSIASWTLFVYSICQELESLKKNVFFRQINNEERGVGRLVGKKVSYSKKFCEFDFCEYPSIRK